MGNVIVKKMATPNSSQMPIKRSASQFSLRTGQFPSVSRIFSVLEFWVISQDAIWNWGSASASHQRASPNKGLVKILRAQIIWHWIVIWWSLLEPSVIQRDSWDKAANTISSALPWPLSPSATRKYVSARAERVLCLKMEEDVWKSVKTAWGHPARKISSVHCLFWAHSHSVTLKQGPAPVPTFCRLCSTIRNATSIGSSEPLVNLMRSAGLGGMSMRSASAEDVNVKMERVLLQINFAFLFLPYTSRMQMELRYTGQIPGCFCPY